MYGALRGERSHQCKSPREACVAQRKVPMNVLRWEEGGIGGQEEGVCLRP